MKPPRFHFQPAALAALLCALATGASAQAATRYVDNPGDYAITTDQGAPGLDNGDTVAWNPGANSAHGSAVSGLTFGADAFGTI